MDQKIFLMEEALGGLQIIRAALQHSIEHSRIQTRESELKESFWEEMNAALAHLKLAESELEEIIDREM